MIAATVCQNHLWKQILQAANAPAAVISAVELIEFRNEFQWVCLFANVDPLLLVLMRRMGYRNVTDRISHRNVLSLSRLVKKIDTEGSVLRSNRTAFEHEDVARYMAKFKLLKEAQIKLGQGHLVILAINPDFLQQPNGTAFPATLDEEQYLHYVAAQSILVNQQNVTLRVFSWGAIYQRTISIRNLMPRFEGYISGQP